MMTLVLTPAPDMTSHCCKPLKQNPFLSYRDPISGKWIVVKTAADLNRQLPRLAA